MKIFMKIFGFFLSLMALALSDDDICDNREECIKKEHNTSGSINIYSKGKCTTLQQRNFQAIN